MTPDPFHPFGRCTCGAEGNCTWCKTTETYDEGTKAEYLSASVAWSNHLKLERKARNRLLRSNKAKWRRLSARRKQGRTLPANLALKAMLDFLPYTVFAL